MVFKLLSKCFLLYQGCPAEGRANIFSQIQLFSQHCSTTENNIPVVNLTFLSKMPNRLSRIPANLPHLEVFSNLRLLGSLELAWYSLNGVTTHRASQSGEGDPLAPLPRRILTSRLARCCCSLKWRSDSGSEPWNQIAWQAAKSIASHNSFLNLQERGGRERRTLHETFRVWLYSMHPRLLKLSDSAVRDLAATSHLLQADM